VKKIHIFGDPDSGDSLIVTAYRADAGTGYASVMTGPDTVSGSAWTNTVKTTISNATCDVSDTLGLSIKIVAIGTFDQPRVLVEGISKGQ